MAQVIDNLMYSPGATAYYSDEFRRHIDDQLPLLRVAQTTQLVTVPPILKHRFNGNLYALFAALGIAPEMHYPTMRVNGINSRLEVPENLDNLLVPDGNYLNRLLQSVSGTKRLSV